MNNFKHAVTLPHNIFLQITKQEIFLLLDLFIQPKFYFDKFINEEKQCMLKYAENILQFAANILWYAANMQK